MTVEKVLIVDDSAEIRALLESVLPYAGYDTLSAGTGQGGLGLALHHKPDVLLLDLELPDIGGLQILEQLKQAKLSIPAVIMTGYGSEGSAARALRLGAFGYLIKPFTTEEVLSTVEKALAMGRLARDNANLAALLGRQARYLKALAAIAQAAASDMDCGLLLARIAEAALYVTSSEGAWIALRQGQTDRFRVVAQRGRVAPSSLEFSETAGAEILAPVLSQGTPLRTQAAPEAPIRLQTGDEVVALLQVPLGLPTAPLGLLAVDRRVSDVAFTEQDEHLLHILASYALLAVERDRRAGQVEGISRE